MLFGPGDKLTWIEKIACDPHCSRIALRCAVQISRFTNTDTRVATVTQSTIADKLDVSERWVRAGIKELFDRRYLAEGLGSAPGPFKPMRLIPVLPEARICSAS